MNYDANRRRTTNKCCRIVENCLLYDRALLLQAVYIFPNEFH